MQVTSEWITSSKATSSTSFLDLPKEIRDVIYGNICGELERKGLRWVATAPRVETEYVKDENGNDASTGINAPFNHESSDASKTDDPVSQPTVFADCAIMRTCRQLHAEFASRLYASPLQLSRIAQGKNILPLSSVYAHLVREVLFVESRFSHYHEVPEWRQKLEIASGLSKMFPQAHIIRLAWYTDMVHSAPITWQYPEIWKVAVREVQAMVRNVRKLSQVSRVIPWNLEIVEIKLTGRRGIPRGQAQYEEVESVLMPV